MKGPAMGPVNVGVIAGGGGGGMGGIVGVGLGGGGGGGGEEEESWRHFNNSINAISFGFVATAILISMFLLMAIFERFLRPTIFLSSSSPLRRRRTSTADLEEPQQRRNPKMSIYAKGVSVLMPGNDIPTFIAHPAPAPCPPERISWPSHQHIPIDSSTSISS